MKPTCPSCKTKAAREKSISAVRVWFRCNNGGYVWRGSVLALAYTGAPLGTTRVTTTNDAAPRPMPVESRRTAIESALDAQLDAIDDALEHPRPHDQAETPSTVSEPVVTSQPEVTSQSVADWLEQNGDLPTETPSEPTRVDSHAAPAATAQTVDAG